MRTIFIGAALLGAALSAPAWAEETPVESTNLERLTHCFEHTPYPSEVIEHGTTLGATRRIGAYEVTVNDGYILLLALPGRSKATARLLIEQVPADKVKENKKVIRNVLQSMAAKSENVQLGAHKADGLEVFSIDRSAVGVDGVISVHVLFHDQTRTMSTLTMFGQNPRAPFYHSKAEFYDYRMGVLSRFGACMLGKTGTSSAPASVVAPTFTVPTE